MALTTATTIDIVPYTTINHEAQKMLGITNDEYCVANAIHNLSHNPKGSIPGWCYAKKEYIAASVNVSRASVFRHIHKLLILDLVEAHPERSDLLRTTAKWYDAVLIKKVEIVVEDIPSPKPQSQNETDNLTSKNENSHSEISSLKMRQQSQSETKQSQFEIRQSHFETAIDIQGNIYKEIDKDNISSYEETQQTVPEAFGFESTAEIQGEASSTQSGAVEGETVSLTDTEPKKSRKGSAQNPDGSYGNREINEARGHFLKLQNIPSEDCTRDESRRYWKLLLDFMCEIAPNVESLVALNKFVDCLASGRFIDPASITSGKKLYYRRNELYKKIREHRERGSSSSGSSKVTRGNIVGGIAY